MIWRRLFSCYFLLFSTVQISTVFCVEQDNAQQRRYQRQQQQDESTIWLIKPEARTEEKIAGVKRLPEAMCPTRRSKNDARSQLQSGSIAEIQWRTVHKFSPENSKIELIAAESNSILSRLDAVVADQSAANVDGVASKLVRIPENFECKDCILRLTVETNDQSQIVSCADVQISTQNNSVLVPKYECAMDKDCGGHGECFHNSCYCNAGFYGENCSSGSRHSSELTAQVESSKYHAFTFPSENQFLWRVDSTENAIELALKIPRKNLMSNGNVEWFFLGVRPEDEASKAKCMKILSTNANSNVRALGVPVRHNSASSENSIQIISPSIDVKPVPPPKETPKKPLKIQKIANSTSEMAGCGENETFSTCPEFSRDCEPSCDWTAFPESIPSCPKACGQPRCICKEGFVRLGNEQDECRPFNFCQASEVVQECARNETWAKCGKACEPSCESMYNVDPCMDTCQAPACTCDDNFVRFNGECIYWGNCPNLEERFLSTTGSSAPTVIGRGVGQSVVPPKAPTKRPPVSEENSKTTKATATSTEPSVDKDHTAQSKQQSSFILESLPDAVEADASKCADNETMNECGRVCEADCVTIFVRGECNECASRPACACRQGFARHADGHCVYWNDCPLEVKGSGLQTVPNNRSRITTTTSATTTLEETTTTSTAQPSTIKASAKTTKKNTTSSDKSTKSTTVISTTTTIAPSLASAPSVLHNCFGEWVWPSDCKKDCDYKISWIYTPETDLIDFALEAKMPPNWWTGVGFSASGSLAGADFIAVRSQNGGILSIHDLHVDESGNFKDDKAQNVFPSEAKLGTHANGILRAKFSRRRATDESGDNLSFSDNKCYKFLFPVSGGRLAQNGSISAALSQPHVTTQEICVRACPQQATKQQPKKESPTYSCQTEYRFPESCESESCEYRAKWELNALEADVEFQISAKGIGRWTGIGFSQDGQMANSDIYTGWVYDHRAYVTDRFSYDRQMPAIDGQNDIYNVSGSLNDDVQTISFRRKVVTKDNATDFPLDRCYHFLFPVGGGRVMARHGDDFRSAETPIGYHDQTPPEFSAKKICLCVGGVPLASELDGEILAAPANSPVTSVANHRRVRRQIAASATAADDAFVCSDIALIEVRDGGAKIRVSDAFALSKHAIMTDAFSFSDISTQVQDDTLTVLMRKSLNESEPNDFSIDDGPATVYLGSGHGLVDFNSANFPIELTRVNIVHPESYASSVPQLPTTESSFTTNFVDFSTAPSDGPFDMTPTQTSENERRNGNNESTTDESTTVAVPVDIGQHELITISNAHERIETEQTISTISVPSEIFTTPSTQTSAETSTPQAPSDTFAETTAQTILSRTSEKPTEGDRTTPTSTTMDDNCFGSFEFPQGCSVTGSASCQYAVTWTANSEKKSVDFQLSATTSTQRWTGIGFSPEGTMANADVIIVSVLKDSTITVMDQYSPGYGRPRIDKFQDVFNAVTSYSDGRVVANFSRSLNTGDSEDDVDLLTQCQRFIFLHSGGDLEGGSEQIRKHSQTPISSRAKVCLGKCGLIESMTTTLVETTVTTEQPKVKIPTKVDIPEKKKEHNDVLIAGAGSNSVDEDSTATVAIPPSKSGVFNRLYDVVIRLINDKWSSELEDPQSERYAKLATKIKNALNPAILARWPSLKEIRVMKFAAGSVLALLQIEFDGENAPTENELRQLLTELITNDASTAAALHIDKEAMQVRENTQVDVEDKWGPLRDFGIWVIVGVVLVVSLMIFVLCMACICKRSSRRKNNRKSVNSFSPHYAYQYTSSGYPTGITNAAYVGGIPSSKDTDVTKTTGGSSVSSGGGEGGKKSDKSPQNAPRDGRYDMSDPGMTLNGSGRQTNRNDCPRGMGETTYQEWFAKVASKDAPSNYQESAYSTPPIRRQLGSASALPYGSSTPVHQSYVTYPNDPTSYYTLNGEHKLPPPSYYHRH